MDRMTMTAKEAAQFVGVSYWLLLQLVKQKRIPAIHAGKRVLFRKQTLIQWMEQQEQESMNLVMETDYVDLKK